MGYFNFPWSVQMGQLKGLINLTTRICTARRSFTYTILLLLILFLFCLHFVSFRFVLFLLACLPCSSSLTNSILAVCCSSCCWHDMNCSLFIICSASSPLSLPFSHAPAVFFCCFSFNFIYITDTCKQMWVHISACLYLYTDTYACYTWVRVCVHTYVV